MTAAVRALGLGALAGVVDDERVEVGQRPEHRLGQAGGGEGGGLAGQPFEVAVLAEMDDRMRAKAVAQPEVEGEIAVRRRQGPARGRWRRGRCGSRGRAAGPPPRGPWPGATGRSRRRRGAGRVPGAPQRSLDRVRAPRREAQHRAAGIRRAAARCATTRLARPASSLVGPAARRAISSAPSVGASATA